MAVADHGKCAGRPPSTTHPSDLEALAEAGIDLDQVTDELLVDGVKQFEDAMSRLLAGIEERRAAVVTGTPPTIQAKLPTELAGARRRARQAGRVRTTSRSGSGAGTRRCGAAPACRRSRTGSAG